MTKAKEGAIRHKCTCCGRELIELRFYMTENYMYKASGRLPICKDCIKNLYELIFSKTNNYKVTMYRLCRKLDIAFRHNLYDMAEREANRRKTEVYAMYFQKMNSLGNKNNYAGDFDDSDELEKGEDRNVNDVEGIEKEVLEGFEVTREMVAFWGGGYAVSDYWFLAETYDGYLNAYEIDAKTLEELVKQICFTHLIISKKRAASESVDKDLKTLQELMTSCNLKPVQETGSNSVEQATFGTLIKKWENEKPIPEPDPEWKDVNNIIKYIKVWFTGHLSRMMGVETGITDEYRAEIAKYTVEEGEGRG